MRIKGVLMNPITLRQQLELLSTSRHCSAVNSVQSEGPAWIQHPTIASLVCKVIPAQCPFARQIRLLGASVQIPPLCKLNPFYDQLMTLRFQALTVLEQSS